MFSATRPDRVARALKMFVVRDSKADTYLLPFTARTHGEAERSFQKASLDPQSEISKFPEDYDLYYLGEYDELSGKISPESAPVHMIKAIELQKRN